MATIEQAMADLKKQRVGRGMRTEAEIEEAFLLMYSLAYCADQYHEHQTADGLAPTIDALAWVLNQPGAELGKLIESTRRDAQNVQRHNLQ